MSQATAKAKYGAKVCESYLSIDVGGCDEAFDVLIANMKTGYNALAPKK